MTLGMLIAYWGPQDTSRSSSDLIIRGSGNTVVGWSSPYHLTELATLWLASTVMGEVGAHDGGEGHAPVGQQDKTIGQKRYCNY